MRLLIAFLAASGLWAQAPSLGPLHVSPAGEILDNTGKPVPLRGLNRSATGSGNADATATDADYAVQNQLLSMNLVRIFVNATWWTNNVQVPIANMGYQAYIDQLIQRAKKYGNYVLILKAGQFPDAPCGADGKNCPATNQGDLNCAANASLCAVQATTGANIDAAFTFWAAFAKQYASDPAILYDTWENMSVDSNTWSDDQNGLIAAIRTYSPQSLIFMEDNGAAFESIVQGTLPDLAWSNVVWNFHLFTASTGTCTEPASARYNNWPQNFDPLVTYAHQHGHAAAIAEWGGCNDPEPYHTNITSYAQTHQVSLVYFDNSYLISAAKLTATGTKVAAAYTAIAAAVPGTVSSVSSANGALTLAPEAIAEAFGTNLATALQAASSVPLPTNLLGTSVTVTDSAGIVRQAELFFVSALQVNYQVPPGVATGTASVTVSQNGDPVSTGTVQIAAVSPGLYTATSDGKGVAAAIVVTVHADGTSSFVDTFQCATATSCSPLPIDLGLTTDTVVLELFGTGIRGRSSLANVTCKIGSTTVPVSFAGAQGAFVGLDQVNIVLPKTLRGTGAATVALTVDGQAANAVGISFK
ncbi:MAG TPA: cellulase family glycosylhydrolase [Bryobacteraceae bacterium]|nr:cellulase family glycosylhydrolase [Bryobacteraceae bacterium]